jgi:molecular chaperone GrpE
MPVWSITLVESGSGNGRFPAGDGVVAVVSWLRNGDAEEAVNQDDVPTGQISAVSITRLIAESGGVPMPAGTEPTPSASEPDVEPLPTASELGELDQALADRRALIHLCLYALDRARSSGVVERLEHGLAEIGVRALRPDGDRFDPALHEAGGAMPTDDPARDGTVAETEVVGFADQDRLLRAPIVIVYTKRDA